MNFLKKKNAIGLNLVGPEARVKEIVYEIVQLVTESAQSLCSHLFIAIT